MPAKTLSKFQSVVAALRSHYGKQVAPPSAGVFQLVAWEIVAYLADDERRTAAFAALEQQIGLTPKAILAADVKKLAAVLALGGIEAEHRARRMRLAAEVAIGDFDDSPDDVLSLPLPAARRALRKFPSVGEPGADKILLFTGSKEVFALESNGLRVLTRIGYGHESKNYSTTYRTVADDVRAELPDKNGARVEAYLLLRRHGQTICKTSAPRCGECPVRGQCAHARTRTAKL